MSYLFICYYVLFNSPFLQLKSNVWLAGCETRVSLQSDLVFHEENCFLLSVTLRVWLVQDDEIVLRQVGAYLLAGAISFNGLTDGLMDSSSRSAPSSPDSVAR